MLYSSLLTKQYVWYAHIRISLGDDNVETQPMFPGVSSSPVIGQAWEDADKADLEEAKAKAETAKHEYFNAVPKDEEKQDEKGAETKDEEKQDEKGAETKDEEKQDEEGAETKEQTTAVETAKVVDSKEKEATPLTVHSDAWASQQELKAKKRRQTKLEPNDKSAENTNTETVEQPESFGKTRFISPEVQCPPKKRGRKPTNKDELPKGSKVNKGKRGRSAKPKEKEEEDPKPKRRAKIAKASVEQVEEYEPPSKRLRKYLLRQKEEAAEKKAAKDAAAEDRKKKQPKTNKGNDKKTGKENKHKGKTDDEAKSEKKASYSRKSAAYHRAYKACSGSEEEKREAARKVL